MYPRGVKLNQVAELGKAPPCQCAPHPSSTRQGLSQGFLALPKAKPSQIPDLGVRSLPVLAPLELT